MNEANTMRRSAPEQAVRASTSCRHLILYDDVCTLCDNLVRFALARDLAAVLCFAPLQGAFGRSMLERLGKDPEQIATFYVVTNWRSKSPTLLAKSRAALFVLARLGGACRWAGLFRVLPNPLLDWAYDLIARNRYRLFGRNESCELPGGPYRGRFIES